MYSKEREIKYPSKLEEQCGNFKLKLYVPEVVKGELLFQQATSAIKARKKIDECINQQNQLNQEKDSYNEYVDMMKKELKDLSSELSKKNANLNLQEKQLNEREKKLDEREKKKKKY